MLPLPAAGAGATGDTTMSSTQHQLIEQCATRLRGIVAALGLAMVGLVEIFPIARTLAAWQAGCFG